jgi:hypothetical protein
MRSVLSCLVMALASLPAGSLSAAESTVFRSGWVSMAKPEETIECARQIGFNALVFHGPVERMKEWSAMTKEAGIEFVKHEAMRRVMKEALAADR